MGNADYDSGWTSGWGGGPGGHGAPGGPYPEVGSPWQEGVNPYSNANKWDPYAQNMLGAYAQELAYAQQQQNAPSAGQAQLRRGIQQGQQALGAQAGAMGANPMAQRGASYAGTQMQGAGIADQRVMAAQESYARQQLLMNALGQRASYEQQMRDDATRRMQAQLAAANQAYQTEEERRRAEAEDEAHDNAQVLQGVGAGMSALGSFAASDRRMKVRY